MELKIALTNDEKKKKIKQQVFEHIETCIDELLADRIDAEIHKRLDGMIEGRMAAARLGNKNSPTLEDRISKAVGRKISEVFTYDNAKQEIQRKVNAITYQMVDQRIAQTFGGIAQYANHRFDEQFDHYFKAFLKKQKCETPEQFLALVTRHLRPTSAAPTKRSRKSTTPTKKAATKTASKKSPKRTKP